MSSTVHSLARVGRRHGEAAILLLASAPCWSPPSCSGEAAGGPGVTLPFQWVSLLLVSLHPVADVSLFSNVTQGLSFCRVPSSRRSRGTNRTWVSGSPRGVPGPACGVLAFPREFPFLTALRISNANIGQDNLVKRLP